MTVTSSVARNDYTGNGGVAVYAFTFPILETTDITVTITTIAGGTIPLTIGAGYTVALNETTRLGTVTLTAGVLASGYLLSIVNSQPLTQLVDLEASNKYPPAVVEQALDRISMQLRTLQEAIRHCIRMPNAENLDGITPSALARANKTVGFDAAGALALTASGIGGAGGVALPLAIANGGTGAITQADWSTSRRRAVTALVNINISIFSPGAMYDGVTLVTGDRVLLIAQTTGSQNGVWAWNGASVAMTRPADYPAGGTTQAFKNMEVPVIGGVQYAGSTWVSTSVGAIAIDVTTTNWASFGIRYIDISVANYDPISLVDGAGATTTHTASGAALGDYVRASFSVDTVGLTLTSWVITANTVGVRFQNETGATVDLASGTLRIRVEKAF